MKILNETELMTNHKASAIVVPDRQFEALQTIEGHALLFSIGADNILYCTREVPGDTHGWARVDLSSALSASCYNGAEIVAKTFDIAQDLSSVNTVDIALVVTVNGQDQLLLAIGFTNTLDNWNSSTPSFSPYPFDDPANSQLKGLPINGVQITDGNGSQYIIADIISDPATQTISRFFIDPSKSAYVDSDGTGYAWVPRYLPADLQAGQITTLLGCGPNDGPNKTDTGGFYVLGTVNNDAQFFYTPTYNPGDIAARPAPTVFNIPAGASASNMAMALSTPASKAPFSDLFFASNGSLYFLANASQVDTETSKPTPVPVYTHPLFQNIQSIHVENWNNNIVLWGQSKSTDGQNTSQIFIMEGLAGQETNANAWSCPIPLLFQVENSTTYIHNKYSAASSVDSAKGNSYGSCSVVFAHQQDGSLVQLFQDPVTTAWQQRSLTVQPLNVITDIYETTTYSTHIEITDDSYIGKYNLPVSVVSSSPCSVYISDLNNTAASFTLDPVTPLTLNTDLSGNITIMQPVDTLGGVSYYVTVTDPDTKQVYSAAINPLAKTIGNLNNQVPDDKSDYLSGATVTDEYGNTTPLVNTGTYGSQTAATSQSIYTICQQSANVNPDGLVTGNTWPGSTVSGVAIAAVPAARPEYLARNWRFNPETDKIWGWTFGKNAKHYEGLEALKEMGLIVHPDNSVSLTLANGQVKSAASWIEAKAGHIFKWMQSEAHKLEQAIVKYANGIIDCYLTIAGEVYHFVAKCANDLVSLVHTVLNAIEAAFKDLVAWIGMIFNFKDILRNHAVMKACINVYTDYCISNISSLPADISSAFDQLLTQIDPSTGLPTKGMPTTTTTYQGGVSSSTPTAGSKSPSANYGMHHVKNNGTNADTTSPDNPGPDASLFDKLKQLIDNEGTDFKDAADKIKVIAANVTTTPIEDTIKDLMAVVATLLVDSAENILLAVVDVLEALIGGTKDSLNATMHIPVLTYMYKKMTTTSENPNGDDLTPLDLSCLICSFFSTVVYKAVRGHAPFPEGPLTDAIINAKDLPSLQQAITNFEKGVAASQTPGLVGHGETGSQYVTDIIGSVDAMIGAIAIDLITFVKSNLPYVPPPGEPDPADVRINKVMTVFNSACYMAYVYPDVLTLIATHNDNTWYVKMNNICTGMAVGKALVDGTSAIWGGDIWSAISPILDMVLNIVWQVPTTAQFIEQVENQKSALVNEIVAMIGGTAFDVSGMLAPTLWASYVVLPNNAAKTLLVNGVVAAISACNLIWAGGCLATTFDGLPEPQ